MKRIQPWKYNRSGLLLKCCALLYVSVIFAFAANGQSRAASQISYPAAFPADVINDVQRLLGLCTGRSWTASPGNEKTATSGFILVLNTANSYKTGESCIITGDGSNFERFEAPTTGGLIYGVYKYLRDLGFKFYLPDDLYTVTPKTRSVYKKYHRMEAPFLRIRDFFGTGGFGSGKTDPGKSVERAWQLWKWRNGFGAEFYLSGHVGETFNLNNADELAKHADWTATPVKKNGAVDQTTKLNYFNPDAVNFFTDWALRKFTAKNYQPPPPYLRDMVSVEPADGGGYIMKAPPGSKLSSVSDQVFYSANVAAAKLDRLFPDQPNIGVNLYAYSGHSDVPSFKLNPRVFVQIIPYQFQNIAFGPTFIRRWAAQVKRFGIYDYFKYPDASWDMPGGYTLDELMKRAINAADASSEGTTYETSYSKFATAIPLWIVNRYFTSGDEEWERSYNALISDLYGNAAPAITRLFNIFYRQAQFDAGSFNQAVTALSNAKHQANDKIVSARIDELGLYLSYVYLRMNSQDTKNGDLGERLLPVEKMAWTLYQKKIIDSYRIMQLVSYSFLNAPASEKGADYHKLHLLTFPESNDPGVYWKTNYAYTAGELSQIAAAMNQRATIERSAASTPPVGSMIRTQIAAAGALKPKPAVVLQGNYSARGYFNLYAEKAVTVTVKATLSNAAGQAASLTISGTDKNYKTVYDYQLGNSNSSISIRLPAGESSFFLNASSGTSFTMQMQLNGAWIYFDGSPRDKMNFLNEKGAYSYDPAYYPTFFYIPAGTSQVQYRVQANGLRIVDPSGNPVSTTLVRKTDDGFEVRSFDVSSAAAGKFWQAVVTGNYNYQMLNIPDRYFILYRP